MSTRPAVSAVITIFGFYCLYVALRYDSAAAAICFAALIWRGQQE